MVGEPEAVEIIQFAMSEMQDMIQWWASMSIGVIALTHFWEKKISLPLVVALALVYTLFTVYAVTNVLALGLAMNGYYSVLAEMRDGGVLSTGGDRLLAASPRTGLVATTTWALCSVGIYAGALTFLLLTYRRGRTQS